MDRLSIDLPVSSWNIIMNALAQRPFVEVVDLIAEIKRQGDAAINHKVDDSNGKE
jgi:hypothetical protein